MLLLQPTIHSGKKLAKKCNLGKSRELVAGEPITMLNPHFVAGETGLFGGHESEDIRTIFIFSPITTT